MCPGALSPEIDRFRPGGMFDCYLIASFLVRDGQIDDYGEDSAGTD